MTEAAVQITTRTAVRVKAASVIHVENTYLMEVLVASILNAKVDFVKGDKGFPSLVQENASEGDTTMKAVIMIIINVRVESVRMEDAKEVRMTMNNQCNNQCI